MICSLIYYWIINTAYLFIRGTHEEEGWGVNVAHWVPLTTSSVATN